MKNLLSVLGFLVAFVGLSQQSPTSYTPPRPYPTNGTTIPNGAIRWSGPIDRSAYNDGPLIWPRTILGSYQSVTNTAERDSIIASRRQEGMLVTAVDDGNGTDSASIYMLLRGLGNTNWIRIGSVTNDVFIPSGGSGGGTDSNISNADLTSDATHFIDGNGFDFTFVNYQNLTLASSVLLEAISDATHIRGNSYLSLDTVDGNIDVFMGGSSRALTITGGAFHVGDTNDLATTPTFSVTDGVRINTPADKFKLVIADGNIDGKSYTEGQYAVLNANYTNGAVAWKAVSYKGNAVAIGGTNTYLLTNSIALSASYIPEYLRTNVPPQGTIIHCTFPARAQGGELENAKLALGASPMLDIYFSDGQQAKAGQLAPNKYYTLIAVNSGTTFWIAVDEPYLPGLKTTFLTDADATLTDRQLFILRASTPLTADRTLTLPTGTYIPQGFTIRIARQDAGLFNLDINGLDLLAAGAACEVVWDGSNWSLIENGAGGVEPPPANFANTDLTATGNRTHDWDGNSLTVQNFSYTLFNAASGDSLAVGPTYSYLASPTDVYMQSGGVVVELTPTSFAITTPSGPGTAGQVLTSDGTNAEWADAPNFANANLTADGDRTHDWDGHSLSINNWTTLYLNSFSGDTALSLDPGGSDLHSYGTGAYMSIGVSADGEMRYLTPKVQTATAVVGQVLTLQSLVTGGVEFADSPFPLNGIPTVAAGSGAGGSPTVALANETDSAFTLSVTAGTTPSVAADIAIVTFAAAYGTPPHFSVSPSNIASATLSGATGVWATSTTTNLTLHSNLTGLVATTNYVWEVIVVR